MLEFKQYKRKEVAELRPVTIDEVVLFPLEEKLTASVGEDVVQISISEADLKNDSPKLGDMIARNPKNHKDQWLVSEKYFRDNFEEL